MNNTKKFLKAAEVHPCASRIVSARVRRVRIPLVKPYRLSFGEIHYYDTFLVKVWDDSGRWGLGESTLLPGYGSETPNAAERFIDEVVSRIPGTAIDEARNLCARFPGVPFMVSSVHCAIDGLEWGSAPMRSGAVPLVGIVSTRGPFLKKEIGALLDQGFKSFKVKVGFGIEEDLALMQDVISLLPAGMSLRADANQGYSFEEATEFVQRVNPERVEYLEQPFAPGAWNDMARLKSLSPISLALDESIWTSEDLATAISLGCADVVKLKLMKHSGIRDALQMGQMARRHGLKIVIGNGVQTDVGCLIEGALWLEFGGGYAGEMNGFLKQERPIIRNPINFSAGAIHIKTAGVELDEDLLRHYTVRVWEWGI